MRFRTLMCIAVTVPTLFAAGVEADTAKGKLDFDRDVRPVLSESCFACHGFDAGRRMAGLRLDQRDIATHKLPSGKTAIVPFNLAQSEIVDRITRADALHMPPAYSGKKITPAQVEILKRWIQEGAPYAPHWAFVPPRRPAVPRRSPLAGRGWIRNPIDAFILARLEKEGLNPSAEADRRTLIRRVTFDLTGLPPTPADVAAFLKDRSPDAYDKVVDRLLASPHYGERMALQWLDLARYADTNGYHIDNERFMWKWRDWVIDAYNRNLPYDQFLTQQLAGDLLPNATLDQKIATGFNRNHPITFEGGAIPEEYAAAYVEDRVDVTSTAFMGLTMKCAQCHDHKYDPISQRDYYRFFAFFNNVPENGLDGTGGNSSPYMKAPSLEQTRLMDEYNARIATVQDQAKARAAAAGDAELAWEKTALARLDESPALSACLAAQYRLAENAGDVIHDTGGGRQAGKIVGKPAWVQTPYGPALQLDGMTSADAGPLGGFDRTDRFSFGAWIYPTSGDAMAVVSHMDDSQDFRGWDMFLAEGKVMVHMIHKWDMNAIRIDSKQTIERNKWTHVFVTYDGSSKAKGLKLFIDGKLADVDTYRDALSGTMKNDKPLLIGRRNPSAPFKGMIRDVRLYRRELPPQEVAEIAGAESIRQILALEPARRTQDQRQVLSSYYLIHNDEPYRRLSDELAEWQRKRSVLDAAIPTTMVMEDMARPKDTFMLVRGQYDKHGDKVTPDTPECLPPFPIDLPRNRLGLARWLTSPTSPLTARVAVNRYWQELFGVGLVKTSENFGAQGERPSNPALLDWLACEFMQPSVLVPNTEYRTPNTERPHSWDIRHIIRLIVTSATYRQSSRVSKALLERDPENRLLARGPRFRLPAEFIRDQALSLAGLLVDRIGGPSVRPYQPTGLWEEISFKGGFSAQFYIQEHGDALYRRGMYTFWKRTCPPPALETFDAPEREFCMPRRSVTDTPLQALVLMDDPTYVEAARKFAERVIHEAPLYERDRIAYAFRLATCRAPRQSETDILDSVYRRQIERYSKDRDAAMKLLSEGESRRDERIPSAELAAFTAVTSMILNLDETITKN